MNLKFWKRRQTPDEWLKQFADLKRSLASLPTDNTLWPGLLALLDQYVITETEALAQPGISPEELRRCQGRVGMLLDLKKDLDELPAKARAEIEETVKKI